MTKIPSRLGSRMVPRDMKSELEEIYRLGEWDFEEIDTKSKIKSLNIKSFEAALYYRFADGEYGEYEELYKKLYATANQYTTLWPADSSELWELVEKTIEASRFQEPQDGDDDLITHLENQLDSPNPRKTVSDHSDDAAELWVRYLLDRGINPDTEED